MILPRGKFLRLAAGAAALPAVSNIARAQIAQAAELSDRFDVHERSRGTEGATSEVLELH